MLRQSERVRQVQAVAGSCYGRRKTIDDGELIKMAGQSFWYFLSGNKELYTQIIEPLGFQAKRHNDKYYEERAALINRFTAEFAAEFCTNGKIDWERLVVYNSGNLAMEK